MANHKQLIDDMFGELNTAIAMTGKVSEIVALFQELTAKFHLETSIQPFELIVELLKKLGVTEEMMIEWISTFLTTFLPTVEMGVKGILLANLKGLISCSIDPRIPDKLRKAEGVNSDSSSPQGNGIAVSINDIDSFGKLGINPLSDEGKYKYFGTENIENVYQLVRSHDMDAFLWFVIHKGKFPKVNTEISSDNFQSDFSDQYKMDVTIGESFLEPVSLTLQDTSGTNSSTILPGTVFAHGEDGRVLSMCVNAFRQTIDGYGKIVSNNLLPISSDYASVNWYTNWGETDINMGIKKDDGGLYERDFSKDIPICNFHYENNNAYSDASDTLRFTVLPKVAEHFPDIDNNESLLSYRRILFNKNGEPSNTGMYSYPAKVYDDSSLSDDGDFKTMTFDNGVKFQIHKKTGKYTVSDSKKNKELLQECYPGLTVFEFNFSYVMSFKLFDAKVLASTIFESLMNVKLGVKGDFRFSNEELELNFLREIIKNIIKQDDGEVNNCFYSFSNEKFEELLRDAEEKRFHRQKFGNVTYNESDVKELEELLNSYSTATTLHKKNTLLQRAITQASISASENCDPLDKFHAETNFILQFIEELIFAIVQSVFSPKVLMLIAVNTEMMGNDIFHNLNDVKDIYRTLQALIKGIVRQIKDLIMQELMKLVLKHLMPIIEAMIGMLAQEAIDNYLRLIRDLIKNCDMSFFFALLSLFRNKFSDTTIDNVDYPDIDTNTYSTDQPKTNCYQ